MAVLRDAQRVVTNALSALTRGDFAIHLPYVHEDVVSSLAQLPMQCGKPPHQDLLRGLRDSGDATHEFGIEDIFRYHMAKQV